MGTRCRQWSRSALERELSLLFDRIASSNTKIFAFLYMRKRLIEDEGLRARELKKGAKSTTQQENEVAAPAGK